MKVYLTARGIPGKSDEDLRILDAIQYGPVHEVEVDMITVEIAEKLVAEFEQLYPEKNSWDYSIEQYN